MDGLGPQIMNEANAKKESGRSRQQSKHPLLLIRSEMRSASPASGTIPQMTTTIFYGSAFAGPHFTACTPCARNSEVAAIKCICAALLGYFHTRECDQMDEKSALVATSLTGNCCRRGCGWHMKRWMEWNSLAHSLKSTSSNELRKGFVHFYVVLRFDGKFVVYSKRTAHTCILHTDCESHQRRSTHLFLWFSPVSPFIHSGCLPLMTHNLSGSMKSDSIFLFRRIHSKMQIKCTWFSKKLDVIASGHVNQFTQLNGQLNAGVRKIACRMD